jgi:hypothetical protein
VSGPNGGLSNELIGVYENFRNQLDQSVVISERGIIAYIDNSAHVMDYRDITEFTPVNSQSLASGVSSDMLVVTLKNGEKIQVPIRNGNGNVRDVFSVLTFLDAAKKATQYFDQKE